MFPNYQAPDSLVMIEAQLGPGGGKLKTGSELKRKNSVKSVKSVKSVRCEDTLKVAARSTCLALSMNKKHFYTSLISLIPIRASQNHFP